MSAPQFTPGPWIASPYSSIVGCVVMAQPDPALNSVRVAGVGGRPVQEEVEANAHLIAAAPELYEALERVVDTYGFDSSTDSSIWQEALAALAKARGEQVSA